MTGLCSADSGELEAACLLMEIRKFPFLWGLT